MAVHQLGSWGSSGRTWRLAPGRTRLRSSAPGTAPPRGPPGGSGRLGAPKVSQEEVRPQGSVPLPRTGARANRLQSRRLLLRLTMQVARSSPTAAATPRALTLTLTNPNPSSNPNPMPTAAATPRAPQHRPALSLALALTLTLTLTLALSLHPNSNPNSNPNHRSTRCATWSRCHR